MPELPEVETIRRNLSQGTATAPALPGQQIAAAQVLWTRTLAEPDAAQFIRRLPGQEIKTIGRRGKYLIFNLSDDALLVHLRMSGDLWIEPAGAPLAPHHRLVVEFAGGLRLAFNDPRKFGRVWLVGDPQAVVGGLGPEPLEPGFTPEWLHAALQERRRQLKPLLLDQRFIAGLGNIYTNEALHLAKLHPLALSDRLDAGQSRALWAAIRTVLEAGIRHSGASLDWVYRGGDFQNYFRVHERAGQPCPECGALVEKIVVGQRGTYLCPLCQKLQAGMEAGAGDE